MRGCPVLGTPIAPNQRRILQDSSLFRVMMSAMHIMFLGMKSMVGFDDGDDCGGGIDCIA